MPGMDDLAPILTGGARGAATLKAQGVIVAWDPDTFANTIAVHGEKLTDLPVASSVEALTYQAGDTVILEKWPSSTGGSSTWWISGRVVIPGTGRGDEAISFLTTSLGAAVARSVIGNSVFFDSVSSGSVRTAFGTFGDLETLVGGTASPGPEVTFDLSGDKFLCIWGAPTNTRINSTTETRAEGYMGLDVSGPTPDSATVGISNQMTLSYPDVTNSLSLVASPSAGHMFTGLDAGSYTVTAKYRLDDQGSSQLTDVVWRDRWLLVIAF